MLSITSADAKHNFGELIDLTWAAPVMLTKSDCRGDGGGTE